MTPTRARQVARFERRARSYIRSLTLSEEERAAFYPAARGLVFPLVACICLLTLYGRPRIDESLRHSWDRVRKSAAWRTYHNEHPEQGMYGGEDQWKRQNCLIATPFDNEGAECIARDFRAHVLPNPPGAHETEKLNAIFAKTPPWLLWFTFGYEAGSILGLSIPDLTSVNRFARGGFPGSCLPEGPFELKPRANGDEAVALPDNLTPRERKRAVRLLRSGGR